MKKKIVLVISVCLLMFGLTACEKTDPKTVDYHGHTYDELQGAAQNLYQTLNGITEEEKEQYLASGTDEIVGLINSWDAAVEEAGKFVELEECDITIAGNTLTVEQDAKCEKREVRLTCVYDYSHMDAKSNIAPKSINVEVIRSKAEIMQKAGMNTIMGISIVFVILILISLLIKSFVGISYVQKKLEERKKNAAKEQVVEEAPVVAVEEVAEEEVDDLELVAVIAAAIAAASGSSTDDFVVRSIKRRR